MMADIEKDAHSAELPAEALDGTRSARQEAGPRGPDAVLSQDELEVVSGGADPNRDWLTDGCAATVEAHSWCGSNDSCVYWSVIYNNEPTINKCPTCNETLYLEYYERNNRGIWQTRYKCIHCGYTKKS